MAKFEIYKEKEKEPLVRLRLLKDPIDGMVLAVVDSDGNRVMQGCLLLFTDNGRITRLSSVSTEFGLELDDAGRIEIH